VTSVKERGQKSNPPKRESGRPSGGTKAKERSLWTGTRERSKKTIGVDHYFRALPAEQKKKVQRKTRFATESSSRKQKRKGLGGAQVRLLTAVKKGEEEKPKERTIKSTALSGRRSEQRAPRDFERARLAYEQRMQHGQIPKKKDNHQEEQKTTKEKNQPNNEKKRRKKRKKKKKKKKKKKTTT